MNGIAVVYSKTPYGSARRADLDAAACLFSSGRHYRVDGNGVDSRLADFHLRGRFFAWTDQTLFGPASTPGLGKIGLIDLAHRRRLVTGSVVLGGNSSHPYTGAISLPALIIGSHGELAWIGSAESYYPPGSRSRSRYYEVWGSRAGKNTRLDAGGDVGPHSLHLSPDGTTVTWSRGGRTKTAPISGAGS